ncbi:MAG: hypothetical protein HWD86_00545 [Kangiellaceae bacterium]|nr:hypothetical protein [Kangiellaceae bacterium]
MSEYRLTLKISSDDEKIISHIKSGLNLLNEDIDAANAYFENNLDFSFLEEPKIELFQIEITQLAIQLTYYNVGGLESYNTFTQSLSELSGSTISGDCYSFDYGPCEYMDYKNGKRYDPLLEGSNDRIKGIYKLIDDTKLEALFDDLNKAPLSDSEQLEVARFICVNESSHYLKSFLDHSSINKEAVLKYKFELFDLANYESEHPESAYKFLAALGADMQKIRIDCKWFIKDQELIRLTDELVANWECDTPHECLEEDEYYADHVEKWKQLGAKTDILFNKGTKWRGSSDWGKTDEQEWFRVSARLEYKPVDDEWVSAFVQACQTLTDNLASFEARIIVQPRERVYLLTNAKNMTWSDPQDPPKEICIDYSSWPMPYEPLSQTKQAALEIQETEVLDQVSGKQKFLSRLWRRLKGR